jgi:rsbT antagonist protein RsbS
MKASDSITCIPLWDALLVPLHGDVPDHFADELVSEVLARIQSRGFSGVLVDLSGVWTLDSHLCAVVARLAQSARLMGADTVLSGISPDIAMTLETMGIELHGVRTEATLEDALERVGITRQQAAPSPTDDDPLLLHMLQEPTP